MDYRKNEEVISYGQCVKEQLRLSGLPTQYVNEYRCFLAAALRRRKATLCQNVCAETVDSLITSIELSTRLTDENRYRLLWLLSLIDDFINNRQSDLIQLPVKCVCGAGMKLHESSFYVCGRCGRSKEARPEDNWLKQCAH